MATLRIEFRDQLSSEAVDSALSTAARSAPANGKFPMLVDCSAMTGYDSEARASFVAWNAKNRERIAGVAIVTDNILWHMVIRAMAFASGTEMRAFDRTDAAERWLDSIVSG